MQKTNETYKPFFPATPSRRKLVREASDFFGMDPAEINKAYRAYHRVHKQNRYKRTLGEKKTLCFPEAFIVYLIMQRFRPETIAEVGTQYGNSTRRIIDIMNLLDLNKRPTCFDVEDELKWCSKSEVELVLKDITGHAGEDLFAALKPDFIFFDARPYYLLKDVVSAYLNYGGSCALVIHDCGRGICNPQMSLARDELNIFSHTGVWERHVLAEIFGVDDPLSRDLDVLETETHRLRIFDTPHGLAVILSKAQDAHS